MHVLIPYAYVDHPGCAQELEQLRLPNLSQLVRVLQPHEPNTGDEYGLSTPIERVMARVWGWSGADGALPFAARLAYAAGLGVSDVAWGRLTPMYWHLGQDHLTAMPLTLNECDEDDARALFEAAQPLFVSRGWLLIWLRADCWLTAHESLRDLPTASLDRVAGRNPDAWMPEHAQARGIKLLQNEVQMLWYTHPVNQTRLERGASPINSLWLSDCGAYQAARDEELVRVDQLQASAWSHDWAAWREAWQSLELGVLSKLWQRCRAGQAVTLTLGGERNASTWGSSQRAWWQRLLTPRSAPELRLVLKSL